MCLGLAVLEMTKPKFTNEKLAGFAKCLSEKGAKLYGTYWCGNCKKQKEMFQDAVQYLNYIECDDGKGSMVKECVMNQITAFPTWIINDKRLVGRQEFSALEEASGCTLNNQK